jgi:hypothetical protein
MSEIIAGLVPVERMLKPNHGSTGSSPVEP